MKLFISSLIAIVALFCIYTLSQPYRVEGAFSDTFLSRQVGTGASNGYILSTDGTNSIWIANSGGGGGGSGIGWATTTGSYVLYNTTGTNNLVLSANSKTGSTTNAYLNVYGGISGDYFYATNTATSSYLANFRGDNVTVTNATGTNLYVSTLFRSLFASTTYASTSNMSLYGSLYDRTGSAGTNGMVLQTNGSGVTWVATTSLGITGSAPDWNQSKGTYLSPSTTLGISVGASSTIGGGTGLTGLTIAGTATTTDFKVTSLTASRAVFVDAAKLFTTTGASADLANSLSDETGTSLAVFNTNPLLAQFRSTGSSTIGDGTGIGGLTINGNGTTSLSHYFGTDIRVGTTTVDATNPAKITLDMGAANTSVRAMSIRGSVNNFLEDNVQNMSTGQLAQGCRTATSNTGTTTIDFLSSCVNNSGFSGTTTVSGVVGGPDDTSLMSFTRGDLYLVNATATKSMYFMTGGVATSTNIRMKIDGAGLVGIGTTSPKSTVMFSVASVTPYMSLIDSDGGTDQKNLIMGYQSGVFTIGTTSDSGTATSAALTIRPGQPASLGVGTSTSAAGMEVTGTVFMHSLTSSTAGNAVCILSTKEVVNAGGTTCVTSSERFKQDIASLGRDTWRELLFMDTKDFNYKPEYADPVRDKGGKRVGVIAEQVQKIDPRLVQYDAKGEALTVHFDGLVGLLIQAVQEQQKQIDALGGAKKAFTDNWQWFALLVLALVTVRQQFQINELKK